jgi:hypothetical protein
MKNNVFAWKRASWQSFETHGFDKLAKDMIRQDVEEYLTQLEY